MEERGTSTERRLKADGAHASSVFFNIKMKWKMEMWTENKQRRHTYNLKRHNTYNGLLCLHLYLKPPTPTPPRACARLFPLSPPLSSVYIKHHFHSFATKHTREI